MGDCEGVVIRGDAADVRCSAEPARVVAAGGRHPSASSRAAGGSARRECRHWEADGEMHDALVTTREFTLELFYSVSLRVESDGRASLATPVPTIL